MIPSPHARRSALVTGAAGGIGRTIAEQLAREGAGVYVCDRDVAGAREVVQAIRGAGGRAEALGIELGETAALAGAWSAGTVAFGPPDILVNNAGVAHTHPAASYPLEHWSHTLAVNLTAPMLLTQFALPHMRARGWGRIVNIASISGVRAGTGRLAYGTSKAGLIALTRQFAIEMAESGVTVNAVAPGPIDTPLVRRLTESAGQASYAETIPMRRFGATQDIADAVAFLASDRAGFITGHTLAVDGGFLASGVLVRNLFDAPPPAAS